MTKFARVIYIFFITAVLLFPLSKNLHAEYFIDDNEVSNIQHLAFNTDSSFTVSPSITFGDLLHPESSRSAGITSSSARIKDFLARLDNLYADSPLPSPTYIPDELLSEPPTNNYQPFDFAQGKPTTNSQPTTDNYFPSPTPYIPIPTLLAAVAQVAGVQNDSTLLPANNSQFTAHPSTSLGAGNHISIGDLNQNPIKTTFVLAILGDSMVDTLGPDLTPLRELLKQNFPQISFALLNYGQGSTDMESGLNRLTATTTYLGKIFPPLLTFKPDFLVIESFAYNHWTENQYDINRHWLTIAHIIDTVKEKSPNTKIILAATIAPNAAIFGDGKLNWPKGLKWQSAQVTKAYLQNMVNFATSQHYPLADAYTPSLGSDGNGLTKYINQGDHLHPSKEGALLFSQKIVEAIINNKLIQN